MSTTNGDPYAKISERIQLGGGRISLEYDLDVTNRVVSILLC